MKKDTDSKKIKIKINRKVYHVEDENSSAVALRGLAELPENYEVYKVIGKPDPEGKPVTDDILIVGEIVLATKDEFQVVPPGHFGEFHR